MLAPPRTVAPPGAALPAAARLTRSRTRASVSAAVVTRALVCVASASSTPEKRLEYTALEGNSWKARFPAAQQTVLVDPWLIDDLTFGPAALGFLYRGKKIGAADRLAAAADATLLLLTQGLDDHAHRPTLARLPKGLPVVASPAGAAVARELGFTRVTALAHGESCEVAGLRIRATAGALVGPPWSTRENGFVVTELASGLSLYYEPHLDAPPAGLAAAAPDGVDVVVAPTTAVALSGYPLVLGSAPNVLALLRLLRPRVLVPLRNDDIVQEGAVAALVTMDGGVDAVRALLAAAPDVRTRVAEPAPGTPLVLDELLAAPAAAAV